MKLLFLIFDILLLPVTYFMSLYFYFIRVIGENKLAYCNRFLLKKGILPTRTYYEKF